MSEKEIEKEFGNFDGDEEICGGEIEQLTPEEFKERYEDFCNAMDDLENLANELFGEMRSFTKEESDEYEAALDAMFEPTGINFCDENVGINLYDNMRDFTDEELKRYNDSIKKLFKSTGSNLFDDGDE